LTCKNLNQILKADVEKFRYMYDPFYNFDINDIIDLVYCYTLKGLEDFKNGKIMFIEENGEIFGYNKEKDVYYNTNIHPSSLISDF